MQLKVVLVHMGSCVWMMCVRCKQWFPGLSHTGLHCPRHIVTPMLSYYCLTIHYLHTIVLHILLPTWTKYPVTLCWPLGDLDPGASARPRRWAGVCVEDLLPHADCLPWHHHQPLHDWQVTYTLWRTCVLALLISARCYRTRCCYHCAVQDAMLNVANMATFTISMCNVQDIQTCLKLVFHTVTRAVQINCYCFYYSN